MRVFDGTAMEQVLQSNPAAALRALADSIESGQCTAKLRNVLAIGGGLYDQKDTFRITLDVNVQLVQAGTPAVTEG